MNPIEMRQSYIKHEASVRSIGILYFLGAILYIVFGIFGMVKDLSPFSIAIALLFIGLGICQIWVGIGLRGLNTWARIPTGILSGIGLINFPIGTIVNGYILFLVFSRNGKTVFSQEYKDVITATPDIKYQSSIIIWILLGFLILVLVLAMLAPLISK